MADYNRGESANIIIGAAAFFVNDAVLTADDANWLEDTITPETGNKLDAKEVYSGSAGQTANWTNVGYTSNGLELMFEPDFGEVKVDQLLDVAKMFKQGMKVSMKTSFAEATLENLLLAIAQNAATSYTAGAGTDDDVLVLKSGELGEYPLERSIVAIGASIEPTTGNKTQRIYRAYRALSIESVTVSAKRDEATMFEVNFRLLPTSDGDYGKIIDHSFPG